MTIAALRTVYRRASLDERDVDRDPLAQFELWLEEALAAEVLEPTAMTLATADLAARPSARIVLLKGLEVKDVPGGASGRGFVWYTNYDSRKGRELAAQARAALCFFWPELERQVRIEGVVEKVSVDESNAYYASRPLGSRVGAWASPQSEVVRSREDIEARERAVLDLLGPGARDEADVTIARPPHWGGYRLVPDALEFWQGRPSRLHDRIAYRGGDGAWTIARLAP